MGGLHVQASGAGFPDDQMWRWHTWTWEGREGKQRAKDAAWRSLTLRRFFQGRVRRAARSGTYSQVSAPRSGSKSVWESKTEA